MTSAPQSLAAALERVAHLEQRLAEVEQALQATTGHGVDQLLYLHQPPVPVSLPALSQVPATLAPVEPSSAEPTPALELIDLYPFVLKALAIRKGVHSGSIEADNHESEFEALVAEAGLSARQVAQLREWAGL